MGVPERISSTMWESHLGHFPSLGMSITKCRTHRCKLRRHQLDDQIICGGPFNTSPRWEIPICHPPVTHMVMLPPTQERIMCIGRVSTAFRCSEISQSNVKQQDKIEDPQNLRPTITEDTQIVGPTHQLSWQGHSKLLAAYWDKFQEERQFLKYLLLQITWGAGDYVADWIYAESDDSSVVMVMMRIIGWRAE